MLFSFSSPLLMIAQLLELGHGSTNLQRPYPKRASSFISGTPSSHSAAAASSTLGPPPSTPSSSTAAALSAATAAGSAISSSATPNPNIPTTAGASPNVHTISVGQDGFNFAPDQITASVGDIIEFVFFPSNHSVAQADFRKPCQPYLDGFWSGFHNTDGSGNPPVWNFTVEDAEPIFFYCSFPGACKGGMVGAINPNFTETLEIQHSAALSATCDISPGETCPTITSNNTSSPSSSPSFSPSSSPSSSPPTKSHILSTSAVIGISLAGSALLLLLFAITYIYTRHHTLKELFNQNLRPPSYHPGNMVEAFYSPQDPSDEIMGYGSRKANTTLEAADDKERTYGFAAEGPHEMPGV